MFYKSQFKTHRSKKSKRVTLKARELKSVVAPDYPLSLEMRPSDTIMSQTKDPKRFQEPEHCSAVFKKQFALL